MPDDAAPPTAERFSLVCGKCSRQIALPKQTLQGKSPIQGYWPTDETTLRILCPFCDVPSWYSRQAVHREGVGKTDRSQQRNYFWEPILGCDHAGCEGTIPLHIAATETDSNVSVRERLYDLIAIETPYAWECSNGHKVERPKVLKLPVRV